MSPAQYRSPYLSSRKADTYGETMIVGRRLGRHLPRIASGDGEDPEVKKETPPSDRARRREERLAKKLETELQSTLPKAGINDVAPSEVFGGSDVVVGVPGRRRLTRTSLRNTTVTPLPSSKLASRIGGLWADVQRQHLQAYEYLCHIGEAQQWIEGCLGEELPFGVVEMDDGLRNGVVLAKLVRAFQGEHVVRKIYEAPKLDFRHSDNINIFVNFVRSIGLPEVCHL
jgi:Ras GTPase-activating-like protein IQGAP2/3